jgi:cation transport regulator ChaB
MPAREDLPGTLKRSPRKAQETWAKTHDAAAESYGDGERAHRTAFSALKHSFEKVDDHWEPKKRKGPSDPRAARGGAAARDERGEALGGVDLYGHTKAELYARARRLGVRGRSAMTKLELARAIDRRQD